MTRTALLALLLAQTPAAPSRPDRVPEGAVEYKAARYTQQIATTNERPRISPILITELADRRWRQSGGMDGIAGVTSRKFKTLPEGKKMYSALVQTAVKNSYGRYQNELAISRGYPDGTRFDDVLLNGAGEVFEHRVREKRDGEWRGRVIFLDRAARPRGYKGLTVTCASCHDLCGTGEYGVGLVPGYDTVFSDPMDWSIWNPNWKTEGDIR